MFNVNGPEILVLALLFVILFGPERLPGVVMQIARWVGRFRALTDQATAEIRKELEIAAHEAEAARKEFEQLTLEAKAAVTMVEGETRRAMDAADPARSLASPKAANDRPQTLPDDDNRIGGPAPEAESDRKAAEDTVQRSDTAAEDGAQAPYDALSELANMESEEESAS